MQLRSDKDYFLTNESKLLIQNNNGKITTIEEIKEVDQRFLYAVGDFTCQLMEKNGIDPQIMIFDLTTKRGEKSYPDRPGSTETTIPSIISLFFGINASAL